MYFSDIDIHIPFISGPNFWLGTLLGSNSEHGTWFHVKSANEMAIYILLQMLRMNTRLKMTLATRLFVACNSSACSVVWISSVDIQCGYAVWSLVTVSPSLEFNGPLACYVASLVQPPEGCAVLSTAKNACLTYSRSTASCFWWQVTHSPVLPHTNCRQAYASFASFALLLIF